MKISKLFHWLYGILMLLPILVFIPNAFYYGFNEQAVAQEKIENVVEYYDTNNVSNIDDLIDGNYYTLYYKNNDSDALGLLYVYDFEVISYSWSSNVSGTNPNILSISYASPSSRSTLSCYDINSNQQKLYQGYVVDFIYQFNDNANLTWLLNNNLIQRCNRKYVKNQYQVTTTMSITDSMSYAWNSVWQNDLFSWSYESFLAEPFKYIGNVFGLPNDNSIYYCLSYWLDISIIWLCFDLIMYVPLLVHRWIDKGVLE